MFKLINAAISSVGAASAWNKRQATPNNIDWDDSKGMYASSGADFMWNSQQVGGVMTLQGTIGLNYL